MKIMDDVRTKILEHIVNAQISTFTSCYAPPEAVVTSTQLAEWIGVSKYKIRKVIQTLVEDGLIKYKSQGCPAVESFGEYRELVCDSRPPINGYCLTEKGYQTETYKKADKEFEESLREWANAKE